MAEGDRSSARARFAVDTSYDWMPTSVGIPCSRGQTASVSKEANAAVAERAIQAPPRRLVASPRLRLFVNILGVRVSLGNQALGKRMERMSASSSASHGAPFDEDMPFRFVCHASAC